MFEIEGAIAEIEAAADQLGLPELSRRAEIPYTTLFDMRAKRWRPKSIAHLERLLQAVRSHNGEATERSSGAAQ